jgi:hypothetical protein
MLYAFDDNSNWESEMLASRKRGLLGKTITVALQNSAPISTVMLIRADFSSCLCIVIMKQLIIFASAVFDSSSWACRKFT